MKNVTKKAIILASGFALSEPLPSDYDTWTDEKLAEFLEQNLWEPLANDMDAQTVWDYIDHMAWTLTIVGRGQLSIEDEEPSTRATE